MNPNGAQAVSDILALTDKYYPGDRLTPDRFTPWTGIMTQQNSINDNFPDEIFKASSERAHQRRDPKRKKDREREKNAIPVQIEQEGKATVSR